MCDISSSTCSSPIGPLSITYCRKGLHSLSQISSIDDKSFKPNKNQTIEILSSNGKNPMPDSCLNWLRTYFHSPDKLSKTPDLCSTVISPNDTFQKTVWLALMNNVHFGQTVTYGKLAELSGSERAARAVGTAMLRNPFQIIVPCHRVVRSDGTAGNYAGGERNNVKIWLLNHETH